MLAPIAPWVPHHIVRVKADIRYDLPPVPIYLDRDGNETKDAQSIVLNDDGTTKTDADGNPVLVDNGRAERTLSNGTTVPKATYGTVGLFIYVANEDESVVREFRTNQTDLTDDEIMGLAQVGGSAVARFAETMGVSVPA